MGNPIEIKIFEQKLLVRSDEGEEYTQGIVDYIHSKIDEVKNNTRVASKLDIALLAAMNIADEYMKAKKRLARFESRTNKLVELIDKRFVK